MMSCMLTSLLSEIVLENELNLAHAGSGQSDRAKNRLRQHVRASAPSGRVAQFHVIRGIEHLHAEMECLFLGDAKSLIVEKSKFTCVLV